MIPTTTDDAHLIAKGLPDSGLHLSRSKSPADKDFLDHDDILGSRSDEEGGTIDCSSTEPKSRIPVKARSLSPIRRRHCNPYAPRDSPRRCQSNDPSRSTSPNSAHKAPIRSLSTNVVREKAVQIMDLFGLPRDDEHETTPLDEDNFDDYKVKECEIQTLVNDHDEFLRLKETLKAKGAVTNEMLRQRLHVYVHKNRDRLQNSSHHNSCNNQQRESECSADSNDSNWMTDLMGMTRSCEE